MPFSMYNRVLTMHEKYEVWIETITFSFQLLIQNKKANLNLIRNIHYQLKRLNFQNITFITSLFLHL